jgi:2'-5' RNA ligase
MRAEGVGFFPERGLPRVIWVGIKDQAGRLPELQRALQEATLGFSSEAPEKRFTGHVTLGRIKDIRRPEAETLAKAVAALAEPRFGRWTASTIELMRSELSPAGATHTALAVLPLGAMVSETIRP